MRNSFLSPRVELPTLWHGLPMGAGSPLSLGTSLYKCVQLLRENFQTPIPAILKQCSHLPGRPMAIISPRAELMASYRYGAPLQGAPFLPIAAILVKSIQWHGRKDQTYRQGSKRILPPAGLMLLYKCGHSA